VCTGHCTVQCPVHRQPRTKNLFSCALSGGSPDSYYALSGVHRTGTVDCPVLPYRVLKKRPPARDRARGSFLQRHLSVSGDSQLSPATSPSVATTGDPTASSCPSPSLLGEQLWLPLSSPLHLSLSLCFFGLCHPLCITSKIL
jgi:hypothetical protein